MNLQVGVKILLKNKEGKYLLVRRDAKKYPEVGAKWDIVGGRIDPGTTLIENLKREVKEETGLLIDGEPTIIKVQDILRVEGLHVVRLTYTGEADGEVILSDEHDKYDWFTLDEMLELEPMDIYFKEILNEMK
mgnify:FL=1